MDSPLWKEYGHLGDDFAYLTKEVFDKFVPRNWYSVQLLLAWRTSISIPSNWVVLMPDEIWIKHMMSKDTTDVIQVSFEQHRLHYTMTHLSLATWRMSYYDSQLWKYDAKSNEVRMSRICSELVKQTRLEFPGYKKRGSAMNHYPNRLN